MAYTTEDYDRLIKIERAYFYAYDDQKQRHKICKEPDGYVLYEVIPHHQRLDWHHCEKIGTFPTRYKAVKERDRICRERAKLPPGAVFGNPFSFDVQSSKI